MSDLIYKRCANHADREAVAKCPGCGRFFCEECVTEHEGRVLCANCLRGGPTPGPGRRTLFDRVKNAAGLLAGMYFVWLFLYYLGRLLLLIPSAFHEGSVWKTMVMK
jgi:hypothetical protein